MPTLSKSIAIGGASIGGTCLRSADLQVGVKFGPVSPAPLVKAQPGTLSTRTNDTDGVLTMTNADHGIATGKVIDIYWPGSGNITYGATVGTVAGTAVPFTGGHGTVLPIATTAVKAGLVTNIALAIVGNNLRVLAMVAQRRGYANLKSSVPASLLAMELFAGEVRDWTYGNSIGANPLAAATVASIDVSNGDDAGASNLAMGVLVNA